MEPRRGSVEEAARNWERALNETKWLGLGLLAAFFLIFLVVLIGELQ